MRFLIFVALLAASTTVVRSAEITIDLPAVDEGAVERISTTYDCGDQELSVEYVNAGPVSLAIFAHEGEPVVASNVIAASGARYASGHLIWWTKGSQASLYDLTNGQDAPAIAECNEQR